MTNKLPQNKSTHWGIKFLDVHFVLTIINCVLLRSNLNKQVEETNQLFSNVEQQALYDGALYLCLITDFPRFICLLR